MVDFIMDGVMRAEVLAAMTATAVRTGQYARAADILGQLEQIAREVVDEYPRPHALVAKAEAAAAISCLGTGQRALPDDALLRKRATHAVAKALRLGEWHLAVRELILLLPDATTVIMDELAAVRRVWDISIS